MDKIDYLHGLRGIAAFIVVIHHYIVGFYPAFYNAKLDEIHTSSALEIFVAKTPFNLIFNGNFMVCIFFILSGYVLSYKFFKHKKNEYIISSAVRRYFRLLLPVLTSVILVYVLMKFSLFYNKQAGSITLSTWWLSSFWDFTPKFFDALRQGLFEVFFHYEYKYNTVLWTITYEFLGSFLVFSFCLLFGNIKRRYVFYTITILLLIKTYYIAFILGAALSDLSCNNMLEKFRKRSYAVTFLLIGLFLGSYPTGIDISNSMYHFMQIKKLNLVTLYHIIGSFFLVLSVLISCKLQNILSNKFSMFLGSISFSIYLIHPIMIGSFSSWLFIVLFGYFSYGVSFMIDFVISLIFIFILSYYSYKYIDNTGIKFSNYVYNRFFKY